MNTGRKIMNVAVVGCGAISDIYLENMIYRFDNLNVIACCANHLEHAKEKAEKYGILACTYEEILADPSIDMVVILTPAPTHEVLIRQALEVGKHVYTEKTMTLSAKTANAGTGSCPKSFSRLRTGYFSGGSFTDCQKSN